MDKLSTQFIRHRKVQWFLDNVSDYTDPVEAVDALDDLCSEVDSEDLTRFVEWLSDHSVDIAEQFYEDTGRTR